MRTFAATATNRLVPGAAVVLLAASCSGGDGTPAEPAFALTEAYLRHAGEVTINVLFVADENDPIWTQLSGVELAEDLEVSAHDLVVGDRTEWGQLGNLMLTVVPPVPAVTATDLTVFLADGTAAQFPIGRWTVEAEPPGERLFEVSEYVAGYSGTDSIEITATNVSGEPIEVRDLELGLTSLTVEEATVDGSTWDGTDGVVVPPDDAVTFSLRLTDHGDHDFYMTSPSLTVLRADGTPQVQLFDPTVLGLVTITDDDVAAFAGRAVGRGAT